MNRTTVGVACALVLLACACSKDKDKEPSAGTSGSGGQAVAAVGSYIESSKNAEAKNALGQIARDMAVAYERETMAGAVLAQGSQTAVTRQLCGSAKPVPSSLAMVTDKKYQSSPADWKEGMEANTGFACLRFAMDMPQYFQYEVVTDSPGNTVGSKFTAYARRQVGKEILEFSLQGVIAKDMTVSIAPSVTETRKPAP